jgi:hypothetical protein
MAAVSAGVGGTIVDKTPSLGGTVRSFFSTGDNTGKYVDDQLLHSPALFRLPLLLPLIFPLRCISKLAPLCVLINPTMSRH